MLSNPILKTDSYKFSHWNQYPDNVEQLSYYFNARKAHTQGPIVYFGLQPIISDLSSERITGSDVEEAYELCKYHFGRDTVFNKAGFYHIIDEHDGKWPVVIYSLPEGTLVDDNQALFVVENICPECFWVPSFLETRLDQVWAPITVATNSFHMRSMFENYLTNSGSGLEGLDFKLHDFGVRGSSSLESAARAGMGHLLSFKGTDNVPALEAAQQYYGASVVGHSVPASEHSVATAWGVGGGEYGYIARMIRNTPKGGTVSVVLDSYDIYNASMMVTAWRGEFILRGITFVVRPDSGDPIIVIPNVLDILWNNTPEKIYTSTGHKLLPPYLKVLQGDGMTLDQIDYLLNYLHNYGFAADNLIFGMGSGMLQDIRRDDYGFTMKASYMKSKTYDGPIFKNPSTAPTKTSLQGRQVNGNMFRVYDHGVYNHGNWCALWTWSGVQERVNAAR